MSDISMKMEFWGKIFSEILVKIHGFAVERKQGIENVLTKGRPLCEFLWKILQQQETKLMCQVGDRHFSQNLNLSSKGGSTVKNCECKEFPGFC